jgi:hypothetical protein
VEAGTQEDFGVMGKDCGQSIEGECSSGWNRNGHGDNVKRPGQSEEQKQVPHRRSQENATGSKMTPKAMGGAQPRMRGGMTPTMAKGRADIRLREKDRHAAKGEKQEYAIRL